MSNYASSLTNYGAPAAGGSSAPQRATRTTVASRKRAVAAATAFEDDDDDEHTDSSDSSSGDEDGGTGGGGGGVGGASSSGRSKYDIFPDPLALIDKTADFDKVLKAKSIGDAISLLCPKIPGLPSKARGKYMKRKNLTDEEKAELQRTRNRDNARRTRKRKKLYMAYIDKVLAELERKVGDCVDDDDDDDDDDDEGQEDEGDADGNGEDGRGHDATAGMDIDEDAIDVDGMEADLGLGLGLVAGGPGSADALREEAVLVRRLEFVQDFLKVRIHGLVYCCVLWLCSL